MLPAAKQLIILKELIITPHQEIDATLLYLVVFILYTKLHQFLENDIVALGSHTFQHRR